MQTANYQGPCFWCDATCDGGQPPEHIIPEAAGNDTAVLEDVCKACNNGFLSNLDTALVASLDLTIWLNAVPGKKGRPSGLSTRSNFFATTTPEEGRVAYINLGPGDVTLPNGRVLKAPRRDSKSVRASLRGEIGGEGEIDAGAMMFHHPGFSRAIHKIAIESIAFTVSKVHGFAAGRAAARDPSLVNARRYVTHGGPQRIVLFTGDRPDMAYRHSLRLPFKGPEGYTAEFVLAGIRFTVDLTPDQTRVPYLKKLFEARLGKVGWNWAPLDPAASNSSSAA